MMNAFPLFWSPLGSPAPGNGQTGGIGLDQPKTPGNPADNPFATVLRDQSWASSPLQSLKLTVPFHSLGVVGRSEIGEAEIAQDQLGLSPGDLPYAEQQSPAIFSSPDSLAGGADGVQTKTTIDKPGLSFLTGYSPNQAPLVGSNLADKSAAHMIASSFLRDAVDSFDGEPPIESAVEPDKNVGKTLGRISGPVQDVDLLLPRIPPQTARALQGPLRPLGNQAFQAPLPFEETPASLADVMQSTQSRLKYANGVSSVMSGASVQGKESSLALSSDLLIDSSPSSSVDRSKDVFEVVGKSGGVDSNGGQGNHNGMGGYKHPQSGFQQFSSSLSPGSGVRIAEERVPELPTPALQRLQMDVQLSETNRIQIDVGVQHRQVYAGLLMDQAALKNLAVQFVPQLEDQLAQSDMDLQEFSAEVRDHRSEQESEASSHGSGTPHGQPRNSIVHHSKESLADFVKGVEEQGLHLVA